MVYDKSSFGNVFFGKRILARCCPEPRPPRVRSERCWIFWDSVQPIAASPAGGAGSRTYHGRYAGKGSGDRELLQSAFEVPAAGAPAGAGARTTNLPVGTGVWRVRSSAALAMAAHGLGWM